MTVPAPSSLVVGPISLMSLLHHDNFLTNSMWYSICLILLKTFYIALIIVVAELPANITVRKGSAVIPTEAQTDHDLPRSHSEFYQRIKCVSLESLPSSSSLLCWCGESRRSWSGKQIGKGWNCMWEFYYFLIKSHLFLIKSRLWAWYPRKK